MTGSHFFGVREFSAKLGCRAPRFDNNGINGHWRHRVLLLDMSPVAAAMLHKSRTRACSIASGAPGRGGVDMSEMRASSCAGTKKEWSERWAAACNTLPPFLARLVGFGRVFVLGAAFAQSMRRRGLHLDKLLCHVRRLLNRWRAWMMAFHGGGRGEIGRRPRNNCGGAARRAPGFPLFFAQMRVMLTKLHTTPSLFRECAMTASKERRC